MARRRLALVLVGMVWWAGCSISTDPSPSTEPAVPPSSGGSAFALFDTATVVVDADGSERRWSVWLAADDVQRQRGLMEVTDAALEGRLGMAFWFPELTQGGFWMRNTRLALTIVFVDDQGSIVSIDAMVPCPNSQNDCPVTRPPAPYRWALEVPTSRWNEAGIDANTTLRLDDFDAVSGS